jgi:Uma2 family endonuclease
MTAAIADDWTLPEGTSSDRGRLPRTLTLVEDSGSIPMSLEEYLAREEVADRKHEYVGGRAHVMAGATKSHVSITQALVALLLPVARKRGCRVLSVDMMLQIDDGPGREDEDLPACYYPDVLVTCSSDDEQRELAMKEPSVVMEVLSKSTASKDRGTKWRHYQLLPSLQQYLLLSQDRCSVDVYTRRGEAWEFRTYRKEDDQIPIPCLDVKLLLRDVYQDVKLDRRGTGEPPQGGD